MHVEYVLSARKISDGAELVLADIRRAFVIDSSSLGTYEITGPGSFIVSVAEKPLRGVLVWTPQQPGAVTVRLRDADEVVTALAVAGGGFLLYHFPAGSVYESVEIVYAEEEDVSVSVALLA